MNTDFPELKFDPRRSRVKECPCGKSNRDGKFVPYIGFDEKGYCHSCDKSFLPELENDQVSSFHRLREKKQETPSIPPTFLNPAILQSTLSRYEINHFAQFLKNRFGIDNANNLVARYFIGTTRSGGTIFWQIDKSGKIRSGKAIKYNPSNGRRTKDETPIWAHKALAIDNFNLRQCLYGEHLLNENTKPCAIVESEKTATIASLYFPNLLWLACGGKNGLQTEKMQVLKGRRVTLYPDLDGFELWCMRAQELSPMLEIRVSDLLERKATQAERQLKLDLADYLLRFSLEDFLKPSVLPDGKNGRGNESLSSPEFDLAGNPIDLKLGYPVTWITQQRPAIERLIDKNPHVQELIKRLDLVER